VVVSFVLALGSRLTVGRYVWKAVPLPGAVLARLPLLDNTIAARYSLYVMLGAGLMLALILEALRDRILYYVRSGRGGRRPALAVGACSVLACVALIPLVPSWPYYAARVTPVPRYFSYSAVTAIPGGSVVVTYPFATSADATPMLWQIAAGLRFKSPGGRFILPASAPTPVEQAFTQLASGHRPAMTSGLRCTLRAGLRSWQVRTVLVQPGGERPAQVMPFFEWLLGRPPDARSGGISAWYGRVPGC